MSTIIAGRFQQQSQIQDAIGELARLGFARDRIATFYLNPPGQHDRYPIGGDHAISPGAKESDKGVAIGAGTGAAVGIAATAFLGPVGVITGGLLGAYVGSLIGGMSKMKEAGEVGEHAEDAENAAPLRHAGMMLAVAIDGQDEGKAIDILRSFGAEDLERADGTIENGDWVDFDPAERQQQVPYAPPLSRAHGTDRRI